MVCRENAYLKDMHALEIRSWSRRTEPTSSQETGARWAAVHGVAKTWTRQSNQLFLSSHENSKITTNS